MYCGPLALALDMPRLAFGSYRQHVAASVEVNSQDRKTRSIRWGGKDSMKQIHVDAGCRDVVDQRLTYGGESIVSRWLYEIGQRLA